MVTGNDIVKKAREAIGYPYRWGGESPSEGGFDCSGLVFYAYTSLGVKISRTTYAQINDGKRVTDKGKLQPGDLIFNFDAAGVPQHVVLYAGNGYVIEAKYEGTSISEHNKWNWEGVATRILPDEKTPPTPPVQPVKPTPSNPVEAGAFFRVICGSYKERVNAVVQQEKLKKSGFDSFLAIYKDSSGDFFRVVVGSYENRENAVTQQEKLKTAGFDSFLIIFKK